MPKLTDEEIQEINRYLAEGKPLPDKYRFLLFGDKRDVELVWNGKTNNVCNIVLPFQTIEQIDEPRTEVNETRDLFSVDCRGRQQDGWSNKLIWGDNKLILSSLKNGPMRDEIEKQGGIKLVYIDPPFDVGADFTMNIEIGDETFTKDPSILEEIAYRDTWGKGTDSFINMIYERLVLMRDLLADDGSIYIHCDWRVCGYIRLILDDIFGRHLFLNEIIWCYKERERVLNFYNPKHDTIFFYAKSDSCKRTFNWRNATTEYSNITKSKFKYDDNDGKGPYQIRGRNQQGSPVQAADGLRPEHEIKYPGLTFRDYLIDRNGVAPRDWWEIPIINKSSDERLYYPTQKPIILINQIISVSSKLKR
ncbi:MAG: site-specific DNA-methyltransferase [Deltaproteobacteria bacterium]|jgi:site-specific DNA-methyltransferase (adenine-specific)/adenine-specific DNA-methyltransferase|nr:site-specific DNA-methyltransferase [Deltaproteobacteria bacterium]